MFTTERSNLVVSQDEHAKVANYLAVRYGNDTFNLPPLNLKSFFYAIRYHDRGFGFQDTFPILEMSTQNRVSVLEKGFYEETFDPISDLLIMNHIIRLGEDGPQNTEFIEMLVKMKQKKDQYQKAHNLDPVKFTIADRPFDFLDSVSFNLCFLQPHSETIMIIPNQNKPEPIPVSIDVNDKHECLIKPWPFKTRSVHGIIIAHEKDGYPYSKQVWVSYFVLPKT